MFYTREQIQRLEKYRKSFETAVYSGFARNMGSTALNEIEEVFNQAYGSKYEYNRGCSICVLGFLKRVGEQFLKEAETYKKEDEKQAKELSLQENKQEDLQETNTNGCSCSDKRVGKTKTNATEAPKTNKRTTKKKVEDNGKEEETGGTA